MSNEPDKVNSGALATMIVLVALSTLAVALVVTSLVRDETARLHAEKDPTQERAYRQLRADQLAKLTADPVWTDRVEGLVSLPIDRAMALTLENVRANPYALSPGRPPEEEELEEAGAESETEETTEETTGETTPEGKDAAESETEKSLTPKTASPKTSPKVPAPKEGTAAPTSPVPAAPAPVAPAPAPPAAP